MGEIVQKLFGELLAGPTLASFVLLLLIVLGFIGYAFLKRYGENLADWFFGLFGKKTDAVVRLGIDIEDFTGRQSDIKALNEALKKHKNSVAVTALGGIGGVGKTALAVHVAHRLGRRFPDGRIQINLLGLDENPLEPHAAMAQVIQAFNPQFSPPEDPGAMLGQFRQTLAGKRVLLILDNARDAAHVRDLIPGPPAAAIVTSRRSIELDGVTPLPLDALSPSKAKALIIKIMGRGRAGPEEIDALLEACCFLPLALRAAGAYLKGRPDVAVADYVSDLGDERKRLGKLTYDPAGLDVGAALGLSARQLQRDDADLAARWRMLAAFPAGFDASAAAVVWGAGEESDDERGDSARDALADLVARNLLQFDAERIRWRLHDLMRDLARLEAAEKGDDLENAARRHAEHFMAVLAFADQLYLEGNEKVLAGLALADSEWTNITAGQAWAAANVETDGAAAGLCNEYPNAGVYVLSLRLHPRAWISWLEAALAAARRLADREMEGGHLGNIGNAYRQLSEPRRAIENYEQALKIANEIGDRQGEGNALGSLGLAYARLGEPRRAIEFHEKRLEIAREIGDRRGEGNALGNLGLAYADLGEPRRAIEYYEQQLPITREVGDRRGEGNGLGNLGNAYADLGDPRRAIELHEHALEISREIGDRCAEGLDLGNLGNAYRQLGEPRRAIEYHEQALEILREIGDRGGEGNSLWNWAEALYKLGDKAGAIERATAAVAIMEEIEVPNAAECRAVLEEWKAGGD